MEHIDTMKKTKDSAHSTYRQPPWIMRQVFDPLTRFLVGKVGLDDHNATRILEVKGRSSGAWRATPVKVLELDGKSYVVAMYGETHWVKNLRANADGRIRLGGEVTEFRAVELADGEKLPILRFYLKRWWSLIAQMTPIKCPDAPDDEIAQSASLYPIFRLDTHVRSQQ